MITVLGAGQVLASDPVGIYAVVNKVVLEPANAPPERIQIWGWFSVAKPWVAGEEYTPPQQGYLYYKLKPAAKTACENEWADLKTIAGTGQCIAFAGRHQEKGRVRKASEKPSQPDEYPIAQGITKVRESQYPPVTKLLAAARSAPPSGKSNPAAKSATTPD